MQKQNWQITKMKPQTVEMTVAKDIKQNQRNSCEQLPFIKDNLLPYYVLKFFFFSGD